MNIKQEARRDYQGYIASISRSLDAQDTALSDDENDLVKRFFVYTDLEDHFTFQDLLSNDKCGEILSRLFDDFLDDEKRAE